MPKFLVQYVKAAGDTLTREVSGNDEGQARIRFLNGVDIAFQPVDIIAITAIAEDRTAAAKPERVSKRKVGQLPPKGWRDAVQALTDTIDKLSEEKAKAAKTGAWDEVDAAQELIRKAEIDRTKLVRANGPGAAKA